MAESKEGNSSSENEKDLDIIEECELVLHIIEENAEITEEGESLSQCPKNGIRKTREDDENGKEIIEDKSSPWGDFVEQVMMQVLPSNGKISKEAEEMMRECTMKFISFVTLEANVFCKKEKGLILRDKHVAWAIEILGFKDILDRYKVLDEELVQSYMKINSKPLPSFD